VYPIELITKFQIKPSYNFRIASKSQNQSLREVTRKRWQEEWRKRWREHLAETPLGLLQNELREIVVGNEAYLVASK
jgi:hypothetical protein